MQSAGACRRPVARRGAAAGKRATRAAPMRPRDAATGAASRASDSSDTRPHSPHADVMVTCRRSPSCSSNATCRRARRARRSGDCRGRDRRATLSTATTSAAAVMTPSLNRKPSARCRSSPGVRMITAKRSPLTRTSSGASTATRSRRSSRDVPLWVVTGTLRLARDVMVMRERAPYCTSRSATLHRACSRTTSPTATIRRACRTSRITAPTRLQPVEEAPHHGGGVPFLTLHSVVHRPHVRLADVPGEPLERGADAWLPQQRGRVHHRHGVVWREVVPVVLEHHEVEGGDQAGGRIARRSCRPARSRRPGR